MKRLSILGSTGSIGRQTLQVVAEHPEAFRVVALAAGENIDALEEQMRLFRPSYVSVAREDLALSLRAKVNGLRVEVGFGTEGLLAAASCSDADLVVNGLVGSQGLLPTLAAVDAGKDVALANKETLVAAGELVMQRVHAKGVRLLPVDSEHSAIFQCLQGSSEREIAKVILTASGGPFRQVTRADLAHVTVAEALRHPNWSMGAKISVDSATMMNKGLEVIEARWLFGLTFDKIEVVIHPESIIHSFVEFVDRAVLAQLGFPDMRVPIQYALSFPQRLSLQTPSLDLGHVGQFHFFKVDLARFPALQLAFSAGRQGGTYPAVLNAANEAAVSAFLRGALPFLRIEAVVQEVLQRHAGVAAKDVQTVLSADRWARAEVERLL